MNGEIWVVCDAEGTGLSGCSCELLGKAQALSEKGAGTVCAVWFSEIPPPAQELASFGAVRAYAACLSDADEYGKARLLARLVKIHCPRILLLPATVQAARSRRRPPQLIALASRPTAPGWKSDRMGSSCKSDRHTEAI